MELEELVDDALDEADDVDELVDVEEDELVELDELTAVCGS